MQLVGQPPDPPDRERVSETRTVTPGYYAAIGLPANLECLQFVG
jgi:hypothetical protein